MTADEWADRAINQLTGEETTLGGIVAAPEADPGRWKPRCDKGLSRQVIAAAVRAYGEGCRAEEREACARTVEAVSGTGRGHSTADVAAAVRARARAS